MNDIEKNDVDISKLFEFKETVELHTVDEEVIKVYLRLPTDADVGRARVKAIRGSTEFRNNLRNKKWEEREIYLPDVSNMGKEDLVNLIKSYGLRQISLEAVKDIEIPHPKEPAGDADLEEHEKFQQRVDEYPALVNEKLFTAINKGLDSLAKVLDKKTKKQLLVIHDDELIKELSEGRFATMFQERSAYYGLFKDEGHNEKFFDSFEEFDTAPSFLKDQIMNEYSKLELGSDALKKSLGVTP